MKESVQHRLLENCEANDYGCWIFRICKGGRYGRLSVNGKEISSHRLSYSVFVGDITAGLSVLHRCDVPACINPRHLFLGTVKENADDSVRKGRNRNQHQGKTVCKNGHSMINNVYIAKDNERTCKTCALIRGQRWLARKKTAVTRP